MGTQQHNHQTGGRGIEWTDLTQNPVGGCKHACRWRMPDGRIAKCYAEELAENGLAKPGYPNGFAAHYWRPHVLKEMAKAGPPQFVFIDSMSDLMGHWVVEDQIRQVFEAMRAGSHNTFQALTKNPRRYLKFAAELPNNLWCGASSAPDFFMGRELTRHQQEQYMHVALDTLGEIRKRTGRIVWMSVEPLSWDVAPILDEHPALDWVIVGAASDGRRYIQPNGVEVRNLLRVLDRRGTAVFFKGNIRPTFENWDFGSDALNRWREDFPVRDTGDGTGPAPAVVRRQRLAQSYGWTLNTFMPAEPREAAEPAQPTAAQPSLFG